MGAFKIMVSQLQDRLKGYWNQFFYNNDKLFLCDSLRIGFAFLLLVNLSVLFPNVELWFSEKGVLSYESSLLILDKGMLTILGLFPESTMFIWVCFLLFFIQTILLMFGFYSRVQAVCVFIWIVSFQNRNMFVFDGEDVVFRLFAFFLIFIPLGYGFSLDGLSRKRSKTSFTQSNAWAVRFFQVQISVIYLSTALLKLKGHDWVSGHAMYYISYLDDLFGKFPIPGKWLDSLFVTQSLSWFIVLFELLIPFALWLRPTRRWAIIVAIGFHLCSDYMMNLFLFHWIMLLGLMTFTTVEDWTAVKKLIVNLRTILFKSSAKQL